MTMKELCARNVSAGLREALNAVNAAEIDRAAGADKREIDDATADLLATAAECLGRAAESLARRASKAPERKPEAESPVMAGAAAAGPAKSPKKK
jgi:hypothetical protein